MEVLQHESPADGMPVIRQSRLPRPPSVGISSGSGSRTRNQADAAPITSAAGACSQVAGSKTTPAALLWSSLPSTARSMRSEAGNDVEATGQLSQDLRLSPPTEVAHTHGSPRTPKAVARSALLHQAIRLSSDPMHKVQQGSGIPSPAAKHSRVSLHAQRSPDKLLNTRIKARMPSQEVGSTSGSRSTAKASIATPQGIPTHQNFLRRSSSVDKHGPRSRPPTPPRPSSVPRNSTGIQARPLSAASTGSTSSTMQPRPPVLPRAMSAARPRSSVPASLGPEPAGMRPSSSNSTSSCRPGSSYPSPKRRPNSSSVAGRGMGGSGGGVDSSILGGRGTVHGTGRGHSDRSLPSRSTPSSLSSSVLPILSTAASGSRFPVSRPSLALNLSSLTLTPEAHATPPVPSLTVPALDFASLVASEEGELSSRYIMSAEELAAPDPNSPPAARSAAAARGRGGPLASKKAAPAPLPVPTEEHHYMYPKVDPVEERETLEMIKRLPKANRERVSNIYQSAVEARQNCEGLAYRGHRLLDQVTSHHKEKLAATIEEKDADHARITQERDGLLLKVEQLEAQQQALQQARAQQQSVSTGVQGGQQRDDTDQDVRLQYLVDVSVPILGK